MPRRGLPGVQVIVLIAVVLLFVYGYYSFNELKSTLRKSEETIKRVKLEEENLSAQLQALTEQKNQLGESLKECRETCKKEKDDLTRGKSELGIKCKQEKKLLADQVTSLTADLNTAKANFETLKAEQQKRDASDSLHEQQRQRLEQENNQLRQEAMNEAAILRDQIADLKRQNDVLREQYKRKLQDSAKGAAAGQNVAHSAREANVLPKNDPQQRWRADNNRIPQMDGAIRQNIENKEDDNNHEVRMQIHGPDQAKVAYFEPKSAKPDHPAAANQRPIDVNNADKPGLNLPHAEQVAPPRVDDTNDQNQHRNGEEHLADRLKRGAKARQNAVESFDHPINPVMPVAAVGMDQRRDTGFAAAAAVVAGKDSKILRAQDTRDEQDEHLDDGRGLVEKPLQIVEPQLHQEEEDQLQGPGMRNERNANEKEDTGDEGEENDEDYQYEDGRRDKALKKDSVNGPHAAPVDEDEEGKEGGLR